MSDCYSNYLRDQINDFVHGGGAFSPPSPTYFAAFTVMPTASGGGTEATGGSYARVSFTNNSSNWPASSGQTKTNGNAITFPAATANWGTIVGIAEFDASSGGNMLTFAPLTTPITINSGQTLIIPVGAAVYNWAA